MAIGVWTDNSSSWFFQSSMTSAKLDSMSDNDNAILYAGRAIYTDHIPTGSYDAGNYAGGSGSTHLFQLGGGNPDSRTVFLSLYLADKGAYNTLWVKWYVCAVDGAGSFTYHGYIYELAASGCDDGTYTTLFSSSTSGTGLASHPTDISAYNPGMYVVKLYIARNSYNWIQYSGMEVTLASTDVP